jgi:hypothetical protein
MRFLLCTDIHDHGNDLCRFPDRMRKETTAERRGDLRVKPQGPVPVHILCPGQSIEGHLEDINNAGAFVTTATELSKGTHVLLEIEIPGELDGRPLPAVVVRRRAEVSRPNGVLPPGLGLKFVAHDDKELDLIHQTVTTLLAIDLLGHGNRNDDEQKPSDTVAYGRPFYRPDSDPHQ